MARPQKRGLTYFPLDVDLFDDPKIIRLVEQCGTDGVAVYLALLCIVYRNGYYTDLSFDLVCARIARQVGSKHIGASRVAMMLNKMTDIGLLDSAWFGRGVLTSSAIQKRYAAVTARNKVDTSKYWLLSDANSNGEGETIHSDGVFAAETGVFAAETGVFAAETPQNKRKENKIPPYNPPTGGRKARRRKEEVKPISFDVGAAVEAALKRTYGKGKEL